MLRIKKKNDIYIDRGAENLTDLNNILTPCPHLQEQILLLFCGVAERWGDKILYLFKIKESGP